MPLESGVLSGEVPDKVQIRENGLIMSVDVKNGQKTGYFLDQKENRSAARRYCKDARVLDCFCQQRRIFLKRRDGRERGHGAGYFRICARKRAGKRRAESVYQYPHAVRRRVRGAARL